MLGARYATTHPPGLKHLVILSSPESLDLWVQSITDLRSKLPQDVKDVLDKHEADGTTASQEYNDAVTFYYSRHLIRLSPWPDTIVEGFGWIATDPTVYLTMYGTGQFTVNGSLRNWSIIADIPKIRVPTLVTNGAYDEASDATVAPWARHLPHGKWVKFANSSHMAHYEERTKFMKVIKGFLQK
ncbi:hypothetical protein D9611_006735 [Ephemerocybe angulata]|uniref:Uncharacterized protein n=1 Tax=Ephemerocybe angulata TaxID=980116 RepID=A0A8H5FH85_9AGAR|nr:hypothetical protein D9611_006735 [Tulosesus angulatus]